MQAYAAFQSPAFRLYSVGNFASVIGRQMLVGAIQYELFRRTNSATALAMVGLVAALPVILLALPAGQVADRYDRRKIIILTQLGGLLASLGLALVAWGAGSLPAWLTLGWGNDALQALATFFGESQHSFGPEIPLVYLLLFAGSTLRTFGWAARAPLMSNLVPRTTLANAVTWNSSLFEIGSIVGPALAGFALAHYGFSTVCLLDAGCSLLFVLFLLPVRAEYGERRSRTHEHPLEDLTSGLRFVWNNKAILATITLDLLAVLVGGATVLLPVFAQEILRVGPIGFGWLRAAQSIGAISMAITLAHLPPMRRAGWALLLAVAGFGVTTIVFGLSRSFWLSLVALALIGAFDNISVVVRHTLVQLWTPDSMRGRVAAVNNIFIGSSNELGAFESGVTAAIFGPVLSVVGGGVATILVVIWTGVKWPEIRRIGPLQLPPEEGAPREERPLEST